MPGWLTEFMKLLGFSTPLIYAGATYWFFLWLDKKASGPAKKAISGWLVPREYDSAGIRTALLELFDRVYTRPLFTWRAFRRSAAITVAVTLIVTLQNEPELFTEIFDDLTTGQMWMAILGWPRGYLLSVFIVNIISDYVALFIIWPRLADKRVTPAVALVVGPVIGLVFIICCLMIRSYLYAENISIVNAIQDGCEFEWLADPEFFIDTMISDKGVQTTSFAALVVHLWLPFFGSCIGLLKGLNYFLRAANTAQWFLKRGKDHPLEAVGFVAAPLMFLGTVAFQVFLSK